MRLHSQDLLAARRETRTTCFAYSSWSFDKAETIAMKCLAAFSSKLLTIAAMYGWSAVAHELFQADLSWL